MTMIAGIQQTELERWLNGQICFSAKLGILRSIPGTHMMEGKLIPALIYIHKHIINNKQTNKCL